MTDTTRQGWSCPHCGRAHGPHVDTCPDSVGRYRVTEMGGVFAVEPLDDAAKQAMAGTMAKGPLRGTWFDEAYRQWPDTSRVICPVTGKDLGPSD